MMNCLFGKGGASILPFHAAINSPFWDRGGQRNSKSGHQFPFWSFGRLKVTQNPRYGLGTANVSFILLSAIE
jgi:hypothetical protein